MGCWAPAALRLSGRTTNSSPPQRATTSARRVLPSRDRRARWSSASKASKKARRFASPVSVSLARSLRDPLVALGVLQGHGHLGATAGPCARSRGVKGRGGCGPVHLEHPQEAPAGALEGDVEAGSRRGGVGGGRLGLPGGGPLGGEPAGRLVQEEEGGAVQGVDGAESAWSSCCARMHVRKRGPSSWSLRRPTPLICRNASAVVGRSRAISRRLASLKMR